MGKKGIGRGQGKGGKSKSGKKQVVFCLENLHSLWAGGEGVACALVSKGSASFPQGWSWGSLSLNSYLSPDHICSSWCETDM